MFNVHTLQEEDKKDEEEEEDEEGEDEEDEEMDNLFKILKGFREAGSWVGDSICYLHLPARWRKLSELIFKKNAVWNSG